MTEKTPKQGVSTAWFYHILAMAILELADGGLSASTRKALEDIKSETAALLRERQAQEAGSRGAA
jgi:hypothetical protein